MSDNVQPYKIEAVQKLKKSIEESQNFIFTDYRGLSVGEITQLRGELRKSDTEYHVVKNNFAKIAFKELDKEDVGAYLVGPTAIAYCKDDASPAAKAIFKSAKTLPIEVKGGLLEGILCDASKVEAFSKIPSRNELLQMLMGGLNAPAQNLVFALNGVASKLVRTLAAVQEKKASEN